MMKRLVKFFDKIKYLGLLGLPSLFFENSVFDFLWLFWLFGFVGIFYNFPVFIQTLKQLWGMLIIPLSLLTHAFLGITNPPHTCIIAVWRDSITTDEPALRLPEKSPYV